MKDDKSLTHTVSDVQNTRLDRWLRRHYPALHQGMIEKLIREGKIRVDGKKATSSYRLQNDQTVTVPLFIANITPLKGPQREESFYATEEDLKALDSWILWEDEDLLVLNKPSGLAVQGGTKTTRHMDGLLKGRGAKNNCTYRLVHRLDKDTSGVFVVAKSATSAAHLAEAFRLGLHDKVYWAVVVGLASPGQGEIKDRLQKGEGTKGEQEKVRVDPQGQSALTVYKTLKKLIKKSYPPLTCLELRPQTGRTHQLRVHCAHKGFPILGDGKYGGRMATYGNHTLHLHARALTLKDRQGNVLTFVAPPSDNMEHTLKTYDIDWAQL